VQRLLPLEKMDVLLLYVTESSRGMEDILTSTGKSAAEIEAQLKTHAGKVLDEAATTFKSLCHSVAVEIAQGIPAAVIEAVAKRESSDVIAIGAAQNAASPLNLLGGTATNVVKHASGTILILRHGSNKGAEALRVLVAVDGSKQAIKALKTFATKFEAKDRKMAVTVVNVVTIPGMWKFVSPVEFVASIEDNLNMEAQTILADADKALSEQGITPADMIIRSGDVAAELIKAAKDIKADLIVIGAQGKSAIEHFLLGGIANKLSLHAPCSTVVVK
jgi:nucleotide-binding universal stress UspA family protein